MTTNAKQQTSTRKRTLNVSYVFEGKHGKKNSWRRAGIMFEHDDGQGFNILIDMLPLNFDGRLVARFPKADEEDEEDEGAA